MSEDLLQGLKDALRDNGQQDYEADPKEAMEKLLKAVKNMEGLSEEDKLKFQQNLAQGILGSGLPAAAATANAWVQLVILLCLIGFVFLLLGYLGYKIYNNAVERERKREMKKHQKEQKKKK